MRLLIVSYIYAPDLSPRAYRWTALAERWSAQGHEVTVVSGWKSGDSRYEKRNGVTVYRVGGGLIERFKGMIGRRTHGSAPGRNDSSGEGPVKEALRRMASAINDHIWAKLRWPDYAAPWIPGAYRFARSLLRGRDYDVLLSVSHPFSAHIVGWAIHKAKPGLPWLVDIGDPFSTLRGVMVNNVLFYEGLNRKAESVVLQGADAITVTHSGCLDELRSVQEREPGVMTVIPPLLSQPEPSDAALPEEFHLPGRHLVFLGTLYSGLRSPVPLLDMLVALRASGLDVHLHLAGSLNDCSGIVGSYSEKLRGNLHVHGMLPRDEAVAIMQKSDILVNIGNKSESQVPSKLIEYLAAKRPILNIASFDGDTAEKILNEIGFGLTIKVDELATTHGLAKVSAYLAAGGQHDSVKLNEFLAAHGIEEIGAAYDRLLQKITATKRRMK